MAKLRVDKIAAPIVKDEFTGSVYFDGTGDYLSIPDSTDFDLGISNEPFTIEFWFYKTAAAGTHSELGVLRGGGAAAWNGSDGHQYRAFQYTDNKLYWQWWNGSAQKDIVSTETPAINTWHHFAISYDGGTTRAFLNGVIFGTSTEAYAKPSASNITRIGQDPSDSVTTHGYHSNVRVCKGHAVYTGNFTPPTRELPVHTAPPKGVVFPAADNRTVLLACQSSTDATADSSGRHTITANGNATAADANPGLLRRTLNLTTVTENTGSVFFDGNGDLLSIAENGNDFDFDADFSIEFWVYFNELKSYQDIAGTSTNSVFLGSNKSGWVASYYTSGTDQFRFSYQDNSSWTFQHAFNFAASTNTWYHVAYQRHDGSIKLYVNGAQTGSTYSTSTNLISTENFLTIGCGHGATLGTTSFLNGYVSNLRICKGHPVYTSNFAPPTRELEVHEGPDDDRTVLLACYDGENIFADKTGRHVIAAYGDRLSSPTPTATDSPVGVTTHNPGLTRNVDPVDGPTFQGGAGYNSQNWLTLPKGTTTERMPSFGGVTVGTRGFFAGAYSPTRSDVINYVTVPTLGNAIDFGNLGSANGGMAGFSDNTRGWAVGGNIAPTRTNVMEYVTMASSGNAVNGGDLITATQARPGSVSNSIRGIVAGGSAPGQVKTIVHHTIQTTGIAQNFGDLTEAKQQLAGVMSPTRGVFAGGNTPSGRIDTIEHITIASTGNAVLFGELSLDDRSNMGGASNTVRGLFGGGRSPTDYAHIEYITMATLGDAVDFGDLTESGMDGDVGAVSNSTRVVFGGGSSDELGYVEIASLGNTTQFGKFTVQTTANQDAACFSNGHGGLG